MRTDSYSRAALRPVPGSMWVWEPDQPGATRLIRVHRVRWNGEEWWVGTVSAVSYDSPPDLRREKEDWNDLSRFWEACHAVAPAPGPPRSRAGTRRGSPLPAELRPDAEAG